ncbi:Disintegrin domain [Trinorchestia longiramus]|nr:Disintegrin domain [Trinorchestia longiramus]
MSQAEGGGSRVGLSEYVSHYSPLSYNRDSVHEQHTRHVRDTTALQPRHTQPVEIAFYSHGRRFHLRLRRDVETISPYVEVEQPAHVSEPFHTNHLYHGTLADEASARVWGSVVGGVFEGVIDSPAQGKYYVERSHKYFPNHPPHDPSSPSSFHSVIYHDDAVSDPYAQRRTGHKSGCGVTDEVAEWMRSVQESAIENDDVPPSSSGGGTDGGRTPSAGSDQISPEEFEKFVSPAQTSGDPTLYRKYRHLYDELHREYHNKYSEAANVRTKRSLNTGGVGEDDKGTCTLSIQTDPLLWRYIYQQEKNDSIKTRDEITAMVSQHIKAVNHIYGDVVFFGKYKHKGIQFEVQRIKIDDDSSCRRYGSNSGADVNKFCKVNVDVSNFLNLHSQMNHDDFCLSYVFTFRDFTGGTLGLAWVASPSGASGGICEKYKTYTENLAGRRNTEQRSLNTGIITFLNYNSRVPPKVSQLTLAHEIGHNFGSPLRHWIGWCYSRGTGLGGVTAEALDWVVLQPRHWSGWCYRRDTGHDFPSSCKPGGHQGNYIMFSSATSGDRPNNDKFSSCSVRNISQVLDAIAENRRKNCFKATNGTFCGNKIVEEGEECDCGYDDEDCNERCCYPRLVSEYDRNYNSTAKMCSRKANTQCSPSQGPCCDMELCEFKSNVECHSETDCTMSANCNGRMASCPLPSWQRNNKPCNEDTKVCKEGECSGSICLAYNMSECFLTSNLVPDKKKLCEIACQVGSGASSSCKSTSELNKIFPNPVFMRPGAPCNNFQGYCDVFQKCRAVDAEGPLARLKNLLFNEATLNSVAEWITQYWYWVVFLSVAFIVVMGVFIKCCAVHTPSSNPNKPAARSFSETLRRPVNTLRRVKRNQHRTPNPESMQLQQAQRGAAHPSRNNRDRRPGDRYSPHTRGAPSALIPPPQSSGNRRNSRGTPGPPGVVAANPRASNAPNIVGFSTDDPPPPYPGMPSAGPPPAIPSSAPPPTRHGYGEGRGHYNRPKVKELFINGRRVSLCTAQGLRTMACLARAAAVAKHVHLLTCPSCVVLPQGEQGLLAASRIVTTRQKSSSRLHPPRQRRLWSEQQPQQAARSVLRHTSAFIVNSIPFFATLNLSTVEFICCVVLFHETTSGAYQFLVCHFLPVYLLLDND